MSMQPRTFYNMNKLSNWYDAITRLDNGSDEQVNLLFVGDSNTEGSEAGGTQSTITNNGFVGLTRTLFGARYDDLGFGLLPVSYTMDFPYFTFEGTWTKNNMGIMGNGKTSTTPEDTATVSFTGTGVSIFYIITPTGASDVEVKIDGETHSTINMNGTLNYKAKTDIIGLTNTTHTLQIIAGTGTTYLTGISEIRSGKGVRVNMAGVSGTSVYEGSLPAVLPANIDVFEPTLTIISLFVNKIGELSLETYESYMRTIINRALNFGDVLLMSVLPRGDIPDGPGQGEYEEILIRLAFELDCAYYDNYHKWGCAGSYPMMLGMVAPGSKVHGTTAGHKDIGDDLEYVLLNTSWGVRSSAASRGAVSNRGSVIGRVSVYRATF